LYGGDKDVLSSVGNLKLLNKNLKNSVLRFVKGWGHLIYFWAK